MEDHTEAQLAAWESDYASDRLTEAEDQVARYTAKFEQLKLEVVEAEKLLAKAVEEKSFAADEAKSAAKKAARALETDPISSGSGTAGDVTIITTN